MSEKVSHIKSGSSLLDEPLAAIQDSPPFRLLRSKMRPKEVPVVRPKEVPVVQPKEVPVVPE